MMLFGIPHEIIIAILGFFGAVSVSFNTWLWFQRNVSQDAKEVETHRTDLAAQAANQQYLQWVRITDILTAERESVTAKYVAACEENAELRAELAKSKREKA